MVDAEMNYLPEQAPSLPRFKDLLRPSVDVAGPLGIRGHPHEKVFEI